MKIYILPISKMNGLHKHVIMSAIPIAGLKKKSISFQCLSICTASWVEFLLQRLSWMDWRGLFIYLWFQLHLFTIFLLKGISGYWVCGYEAIEQISTAAIMQIHLQSQSKLFSFGEGKKVFSQLKQKLTNILHQVNSRVPTKSWTN